MKKNATIHLFFRKVKPLLFFGISGLFLLHLSSAVAQPKRLPFTKGSSGNVPPQTIRSVRDQGARGVGAMYTIPEAVSTNKIAGNTIYQMIHLKDFGSLRTVGRPALPVRYDLVLIPKGASVKIKVTSSKPVVFHDILACPALKPATDRKGDPEPAFEIDSAFYNSNATYPESPVKIIRYFQVRGLDVALIQICPLQYMPAARTLKAFHEISYDLEFTGAADFFSGQNPGASFLKKLSNVLINAASVTKESEEMAMQKAISGPSVNYVILTHDDYREAADSLAEWKSQLGYTCEVISATSWTSPQVKSAIQQRYQFWNPKPDYLVIIGDHDLVPGEMHQDPMYGDNFATDLYYVCMDGAGDNIPDMAYGRISVASASQAMSVVRKIIRYEKYPPLQTAFYNSGVNCANFQDDDSNSYEDRRFALTEEELREYMTTQQGFNITRVYQADNYVTPLFWNNDYYAAGEPVPTYLQKPGFAWDGDKYDIRDEINAASGRLFITHRDHGYVGGSGWANPQFTTTDINMLNNGDRTPVVFSINCHTGEYQLPECFSEKFLRYTNGGAVGVFGAAYYSYSGYNDGLILGMFDAIWPTPGLLPNFTGYADDPVGSPVAHTALYSMGDVLNQGLLRMMQTWGDDSYTHELFHYFGDPAMQIWTNAPVTVSATHTDSLFCGDTLFEIYTSSFQTGLATLVVDGQLIAETILTAGAGVLHFPPLAGTRALVTISGHNYRPYIAEIPVDSQCVRAAFYMSDSRLCINNSIVYTNTSTGNIISFAWDFGSGAVPATASTTGPHTVYYTTPGPKNIRLTVTGTTFSHTDSAQINIEQVCSYPLIPNDVLSINACEGMLTDNGGSGPYSPNTNDTAIVTATGATNLQLVFNDFDIEPGSAINCDYDWISIYDGPSAASALLGTWCNAAGMQPPAPLVTSSNSFTAIFHSDTYTQMRGFNLEWTCANAFAPPNTTFIADKQWSCNGLIQFTDYSLNNPTSWHWDFGDGDTSLLQNPVHVYRQNGLYTVNLTTSNIYGPDTYAHTNYITIDRPEAPAIINDMICTNGTASLQANGSGTIYWFDAPTGGNLLDSGNTFTSPLLTSTTSYFAEDHTEDHYFLGPPDSTLGSGAFYSGTSNHFLRFDALTDLTLVSVKVYAMSNASRKISLRNASGSLLHDTVVTIAAGMHRIYLNFPVPEGNGYRLQCDSLNYLYRNAGGAEFPYTIPEIISITGNSYSNQNYYYFFYDWEVRSLSCNSPRSEAIAFVHTVNPSADFSWIMNNDIFEFTDQSSEAAAWSWDFGDGNHSALQNPDHSFAAYGTYYVTLTVLNGCGSNSISDTIDYYTVGIDEADFSQLIILQPNPAHDEVTISIQHIKAGNIAMELTDITGRKIISIKKYHSPGTTYALSTTGLRPGVYILSIFSGEGQGNTKLIKY